MTLRGFSTFVAAVSAAMASACLAVAQAPGGGSGPPPAPQVTVAKPIVKTVVELDDFTGRFDAVSTVDVRARVSGYLEKVAFDDGALVNKGDVLVVIDRRPYKAALDQAQASVTSAEAALQFSQTDLERAQTLSRSGNISEQITDQRRQSAQTAQANLASARAAVQQAQLNYDYSEIKAPITGRISRRLVTPGNLVNANDTLITTIVSIDPIYFYFTVDERSFLRYQEILNVGAGATRDGHSIDVAIALTGDTKPTRHGKLDFVDNRLDQNTNTILLRATVPNPDGFLKPGLFGVVSMPASPPYKAVLIPDEALSTNQDRRVVYAVDDKDAVSQVVVRPGPKIDGYRVIRSGLKGDERIVIAGLQRIRPGIKVTPQLKELPPKQEY